MDGNFTGFKFKVVDIFNGTAIKGLFNWIVSNDSINRQKCKQIVTDGIVNSLSS